ncbi:MAG TPA: FAD-binding oxidoreductase [Propionibacteriaceae bacterium]|nr:FAD-binding oxidoreductase [Propionibacteriaceae bacterium]
MTTTGIVETAALDGGYHTLTSEQLEDLDARVQGRLLVAGDQGWNDAVAIWNGMAARLPALVLQPASAHDVAAAVSFARDHGLLLSVKGGGHNIAGTSMAPGGLTLDLSRMRQVSVDPQAKLAQVGPGCLLGEVDQATQAHGLATVLGFVSETGVAGLTLGGGFGYLARRFGWTVDNLAEVEIVTADGQVRTANRDQHPELFWALRGGGGNFGVVTRFSFRLHQVGPMITGGLIVWSAERADEVLAAYRDLTEQAPRELTAAAIVRLAPPAPFLPQIWHGKPIVGIQVCHSGANADADLAPVRALGNPIVDLVGPKPYVAMQSMLNAMEPKWLHRYWKAEFFPGLSSGFLDAFRSSALPVTSPLSQSVIFHLAGALNDHEDDDGAVGNRDAHYIGGFNATWPPGAPADPHVAWARDGWERIRPFSTGGNYVNFQLAEDDSTRTATAYGKNYQRLQRVKADYDPDNLFRVNRNIPPAP